MRLPLSGKHGRHDGEHRRIEVDGVQVGALGEHDVGRLGVKVETAELRLSEDGGKGGGREDAAGLRSCSACSGGVRPAC